jgi:hypothetical protein
MSKTLRGADFVALRTLSTREGIVARVGERCDFVPVSSLDSLLASGKIAPAPEPKVSKKAKE